MSHDMMSLPLPWFRRDRIRVRRPFFDAHHVSALVVPNGFPYPAARPLRHDSMTLRVECLDTSLNSTFCASLMDALKDPDLVAANARALRKVLLAQLVPTDVHYALVDPDNPAVLHLATQMAFPPSSTFAQRQQHTTCNDNHNNKNTTASAPNLQASEDDQDENCVVDNSDENRNNSGDGNDSDAEIQSTSSSSGSSSGSSSSVDMQRQQEHDEQLAKVLTSHRNGQEPIQLHRETQGHLEQQTQTHPTQLQ